MYPTAWNKSACGVIMHFVFIDNSRQRNPSPQGLRCLLAIRAVVISEQPLSTYASARVDRLPALEGCGGRDHLKWGPSGSDAVGAPMREEDQTRRFLRGMRCVELVEGSIVGRLGDGL